MGANVGGRPREIKDGKTCGYVMDAECRSLVKKHQARLKKKHDRVVSKSEAVRDLIRRGSR